MLMERRQTKWALSCRAVAQTIGYAIDNGCHFAVLSSYKFTYFFRLASIDQIFVSDRITDTGDGRTDLTVLRAFAYFMHLCTNETGKLDTTRFRRKLTNGYVTDESVAGEQNNEKEKKQKEKKNQNVQGESSVQRSEDSSQTESLSCGVSDDPIPTFPWTDLCMDQERLGFGRNGSVGLVSFKESSSPNLKKAALKMFDVVKGGLSSFERERSVYRCLSSFQGQVVPRLLFQTVSFSGNILGLGLELCHRLPKRFQSWTLEQRNQAYEALQLLASCSKGLSRLGPGPALGLAHNDIRAENFVLAELNRVMVLDFEDTVLIRNERQRKSYLDKVWSCLQLG